MTGGGEGPALCAAREEITAAVREGASLDDVADRLIDHRPLSPDARDALWLFAWTTADRRRFERREVPTL